jgi:hypothetical protein
MSKVLPRRENWQSKQPVSTIDRIRDLSYEYQFYSQLMVTTVLEDKIKKLEEEIRDLKILVKHG